MTKTLRMALLCTLPLAAACGASAKQRPTAGPTTPTDVQSQVQGVVEQWRQAWELRSMDALAALYVQSPDTMSVHQGHVQVGWSATQDAIQSFFNSHPQIKLTLGEVKVVSLGPDAAVATATLNRKFGDGVTTTEEDGAETWVFHRINSSWKLISTHFSYAPLQ